MHAKVLLDSIGANGSAPRLTTWIVTFERFLLPEMNTHRMFSRNYPSSRAIPVKKRNQMARENPVIPIWTLEKAGMQGILCDDPMIAEKAELIWRDAANYAVKCAEDLMLVGVHKQVANRLTEPFVTVTGLLTSVQSGWENFFALRAEEHADPHIHALAHQMLVKYNDSTPKILQPGEWHIPFGDKMPKGLTAEEKMKVAVARAARVSYNSFEGPEDVNKDFTLHDRLAASGHWSAFEHIAQVPVPFEDLDDFDLPYEPSLGGNLPGWIQLRKSYPNEYRKDSRVIAKRS
jgi:thymidylate synthase ThyX